MGRLLSKDGREARHNASVMRDVQVWRECKGDMGKVSALIGSRRTRRLRRALRDTARMHAHAARATQVEASK